MIQNKNADPSDDDPIEDLQRLLQKAREVRVKRTVWMWVCALVGAVLLYEYWPLGIAVLAAALFIASTRSKDRDRIEEIEGEILLTKLKAAADNAVANGQEPATARQLHQTAKLLVQVGSSRSIELGMGEDGRPTFSTERADKLIRELQAERGGGGGSRGENESGGESDERQREGE
ncbi:MAG: hypothetical protein ISN29_11750 [Gammaproteobacteria bacterium AqS3]|nr:hypothetical protein [Gammaproteobacteria bacterium AqS3]